jgi:hypothetical protein
VQLVSARVLGHVTAALTIALLAVVLFGCLVMAPALEGPGRSTLEAYGALPGAALASVVAWATAWAGACVLGFLAARALLELIDVRVTAAASRVILAASVPIGLTALLSAASVIPFAASSLAFTRLGGPSLVNPAGATVLGLVPLLGIASATLVVIGLALRGVRG